MCNIKSAALDGRVNLNNITNVCTSTCSDRPSLLPMLARSVVTFFTSYVALYCGRGEQELSALFSVHVISPISTPSTLSCTDEMSDL